MEGQLMAKKYVRMIGDRVLEVYESKNLEEFKRMIKRKYHSAYNEYFTEYAGNKKVNAGDQLKGDRFIAFVEPPDRKVKNIARGKIVKLRGEAIDLLIANSEDPEVAAISALIEIEKGKI